MTFICSTSFRENNHNFVETIFDTGKLTFQGSQFITVKDLHNIRQKMRLHRYGDKTEEEILIDELEKIGS